MKWELLSQRLHRVASGASVLMKTTQGSESCAVVLPSLVDSGT